MPPVAMPGFPVGLIQALPSGKSNYRAVAFEYENEVVIAGEAAGDVDPIRLNGLDRDARQSRHLAGMRRQHQRPAPAIEQMRVILECIQPISVQHQRNLGLVDGLMHKLDCLGMAADARANRHDGHGLRAAR